MPTDAESVSPQIGSLNENHLHLALKEWYAKPQDRFEVSVGGYVIDIVRGDLLIEIQTRNLGAIRHKLITLSEKHRVRVVYPIAVEKWIVKLGADGDDEVRRRKSPKKGSLENIFDELVYFPQLPSTPNLTLEVLLIHEEEVRRHSDTRGWRRKGWVSEERRLLEVVERHTFERLADLTMFLPDELPDFFTTSDLAEACDKPRRLTQKIAYCLRETGLIVPVDKRGNAIVYQRTPTS